MLYNNKLQKNYNNNNNNKNYNKNNNNYDNKINFCKNE